MLDARYFAFVGLSALLVISPGATFAVVVETALSAGRRAAVLTALGVGLANAMLATAMAFGLSGLLARWPSALQGIRIGGGAYLSYLGLRGLALAIRPRHRDARPAPAAALAGSPGESWSHVLRGVLTNLLNPPVLLFYLAVVPQFIGSRDPFLARALLLGATHVAMAVAWQASCGLAVGFVAERMARPAVRNVLSAVTGAVLVTFGLRLLW